MTLSAPKTSLLVDPAYFNFPEYALTFGPEVSDLAALAGFPPDPEQAMALDALFALGPDGNVAAFEFAVVCARQNMKTGLFKMAALGWLYITKQQLIVWSAHEMSTTKEAFGDLQVLVEAHPSLRKWLKPSRTNGIFAGNGDESIELANPRRRIKFKARTHGGGRGLTGDKVILDEAYALKPAHMGSLLPTLSARPDPQVVYGSSAGHAASESLRSIRDRGRVPGDPSLAYLEYCAPEDGCAAETCTHTVGIEGCALDDRGHWQRANPAMGRRITPEYIASERRALPPVEFARERLGWWDKPAIEIAGPISASMWNDLKDLESAPVDPVAFGLHISQDRSTVAIGVAGRRADGKVHVGVVPAAKGGTVDSLPGTGWIAARLKELQEQWSPCAVIVDGYSAAASLIPALTEVGVEVVTTNASDMARACGNFYDAVVEDQIRHRAADPLAKAVAAAKKRELRDAWAWDRKDSNSDITQLIAVTLALHGLIVHGPKADTETEVWGFWE